MNERDRTINIPETRERARRAGAASYKAFATMEETRILAADAASDVWQDELARLYTRVDVLEQLLAVHYGGTPPYGVIDRAVEQANV